MAAVSVFQLSWAKVIHSVIVVSVLTWLQVFDGGVTVGKSSIPSGPSPSPPGGMMTGSPPGGRMMGMMMWVSAVELSE